MIQFSNAKLYKIHKGFRFRNDPKNPYMILYLSENSTFLNDYNKLSIQRIDIKNAIVPVTKIPRSYPTSQDRKIYKNIGYYLHPLNKPPKGKNVIVDISKYLYLIDKIYKPKTYRQKHGNMIMNIVNDAFFQIPSNYEKILMYSIKIDKDFNENYINRKIFLFLETLQEDTYPFDHMIICLTSDSGTYYRILIKDREFHFTKVRNYIKNVNEIEIENELEFDNKKKLLAKNVIDSIKDKIDEKNKNILSQVINDFIDDHPEKATELLNKDGIGSIDEDKPEANYDISTDDAVDLASIAILVKNNNNFTKSKQMVKNSKKSPSEKLKHIEKRFVDPILVPPKAVVDNDDIVYKSNKISEAVDNVSPTHIFEKRKRDFSENLQKDMKLLFKSLEIKDVPLYVEKVQMIETPDQEWNLNKSDISFINVTLKDTKNKIHDVKIQIPRISEDGTFFLNGKRKCIINQMVQLPIQFPKPFSSKFESSYSMFYIYSKHAKLDFLQIFMGTYKISLASIMFFAFGFEKTLNKFGIKYFSQDEKPAKEQQHTKKIDNKYYVFTNIDSELKSQFINSFIRDDWNNIQNDQLEIFTKPFFSKFIIKITGRVNSIYLIKNNIDNIVDNISKGILASKGLPSKLIDIMYYMANGAVDGYVLRRNDISNQRIRSSEIISHILQKQIMTAHTIYKEKYLAGNDDASFEIPETQLISEFGMAEIVANMEYANPIEELSTMTRTSPVGKNIGGIPDRGAITTPNRGLHSSLFGNIDPVDTPEGGSIGIVQQLTMGAAITTTRGLFGNNEDKAMKKPSMAISPLVAMVPFMSNNDGNRVMFSCSQMKQAVPLAEPEPPIVQSGYESIITHDLSENFIKRSKCNGKVIKISDEEIVIKCNKTNKIEKISTIPVHLESGSGLNTLSVFKNTVKEGQSVKINQRLSEGGSVKNGFISLGKTLCTAYMSYKGYNFEDGIVISEKLVSNKKLTSVHGIIEEIKIGPKDKILHIANIGEKTEHGDVILKKSIGDLDELLGLSDSDEDDLLSEFENGQMIRKSPGGVITDIEIFTNGKIDRYTEEIQKLIKRTNRNKKNPKLHYRTKKGPIKGMLVRIKINQERDVTIGDKLTNRYGAKGIVSLIEKEEYMPVTPWGDKVDIIVNPIGVINRMNVGQLLENNIGLISKVMALNIIQNKNSKSKVISMIKNVLKLLDKTKNQVMVSSIVTNITSLSNNDYRKFILDLENHSFFPIIIPPYKSPSIADIAAVFKYLKTPQSYSLMLPEFGTKTLDKITVGYSYYLKLEHIASLKLHSRSTGTVISKTGQPPAGKRSGGGVRVGEADVYSMLSHNTTTIVNELFGAMSDGTQAKNEEISNILMNGRTDYVHPKFSQVSDLLRCYFMAMMLSK